jgi:hypothetical protein
MELFSKIKQYLFPENKQHTTLHWRYVRAQINKTSASAICHHLFGLDVINLAVVLIFNFCNFIQHWLSADVFQIPPHRQCGT